MKPRINMSKKAICFVLTLVLVLSSLGLTAFADVSKTVTVDMTYERYIHHSQVGDIMQNPEKYVPATYNYDDGTYKGILSLTYAGSSSPSPIPGSDYLKVSISAKYSGTVTAPDVSKTITVDKTYERYVHQSQVGDIMNNPRKYVPSTYDYDDGTYKGTLSLTYAGSSSPSPIPGSNYLKVYVSAKYSGTVYRK